MTTDEWEGLSDMIKYAGVKQMLGEDFYNSLCLDNKDCNTLSNNNPIQMYNSHVLRIPTVADVEEGLINHFKLTLWGRFMKIVEQNVGLICIFTVLFQITLVLFTALDFGCTQNQNNIIRIFLQLLFKLLGKIANFL